MGIESTSFGKKPEAVPSPMKMMRALVAAGMLAFSPVVGGDVHAQDAVHAEDAIPVLPGEVLPSESFELRVVKSWEAFVNAPLPVGVPGYYFPGDKERSPHLSVVLTDTKGRKGITISPAPEELAEATPGTEGKVFLKLRAQKTPDLRQGGGDGWSVVR